MSGAAETHETTTPPIRIGGVVLAVRDLARVEAFYCDVIGLRRIAHEAGRTQLGAGAVTLLELVERPDAQPDDSSTAGLYHTAFLLPSHADLADWVAHLTRLRYPLDGSADHLVSEALYVSDPEGNGVEVYADRPRASWEWNGSKIRMANQRLDTAALLALQTQSGWTGAPSGTRIGHMHLRVGDVARAADFYSGVIGLDVTLSVPGAVFMSSGGYHHHVAANSWRSGGAAPRNPAMAGLVSVTLDLAAPDTLAAITERSGQSDIAANGLRDPWGTEMRFRLAAA